MIRITQGYNLADRLDASMFEDRKRLFVDTLAWDVPVVGGRFEIDDFDGDHAVYLAAVGEAGEHIGSMRLLPTMRPHILGALFPVLCDDGAPAGEAVLEITRLCLPSRLGAARRLHIRDRLISAMVDHALRTDICALTGVVSADFRAQILCMGWRCAVLGAPTIIGGRRLGAFRIDIDGETPGLLAANGIYTPSTITAHDARQAA